eukprot:gnl/MRDRNA2_/MRDRNA2_29923_c0_seq1.p1 gnl/MRDRNA2_/MRDRNA2_29923_c0~~gnl/MRDRNA2_/MRDRNA2_29923_c0_seq1.p1  ORF type:complete len:249 (-),score=28.20 gnl/MRDRNA2_/MRDRNA2_29923_c0_seq1:108-854(-)
MGPVGDRFFIMNPGAGSPRSQCQTYPHSPVQSVRRQLDRAGYRGGGGPCSPCQARAQAPCDRTSGSFRRSQSICPDNSPTLPIRRRNGLNISSKASMKENDQTEKTLKDIELAVKAVHTALACNRAKVAARCLSPVSALDTSPNSRNGGTPLTTRSLAAARLAKQKSFSQEMCRSPCRSPRNTMSDDPLATSRRSLADARDQHKISKQAVERAVSYSGGLLAKLDDIRDIAVACAEGPMGQRTAARSA